MYQLIPHHVMEKCIETTQFRQFLHVSTGIQKQLSLGFKLSYIAINGSHEWLLWLALPAPHEVFRWCFAAAPAAPGVAVWLSPAGAASLCSYWCSPSAGGRQRGTIFLHFPLSDNTFLYF